MLLRNVVANLLAAIRMWGNPAVWVALFILVIGMIARTRTGLAFMPGIGAGQLEAAFPFVAALGIYLVFLAVALVLVSQLTAQEMSRPAPLWGSAAGTFLLAILAGTMFIAVVASLVSRAGFNGPWLQMVGAFGDALIMPGYVLIFARLDGDANLGLGDTARAVHVIIAALIVIGLGIVLQTAIPKVDVAKGLIPLLPSFILAAAVTITQLLIACSASRAMSATNPPESAFR